MAFSITDWNINENREWFVRLSDGGSNVVVALYYTQAAAESQTGEIDSGTASFGVSQTCVLSNIALFQNQYSWNLKVTGVAGDSAKVFRVKPFVELEEITHSIYRDSGLITSRSTYEVNLHTSATMTRDLPLASHLPTVEVGDIARLNSVRRNVNDLSQISSHTIIGNTDSLTSSITTVKYVAVTR